MPYLILMSGLGIASLVTLGLVALVLHWLGR